MGLCGLVFVTCRIVRESTRLARPLPRESVLLATLRTYVCDVFSMCELMRLARPLPHESVRLARPLAHVFVLGCVDVCVSQSVQCVS